jgi:squalene-hopene/tetraprenyl-beta-curcumene cyclase
MKATSAVVALLVGAGVGLAAIVTGADGPTPPSWSPKSAAAYLDRRAEWWSTWQGSKRDHGTFCVSCHTTLPYALARPALHGALAEDQPGPVEARIVDNLVARVRMWRDAEPFYPDQTRGLPKSSESRGTESVLNALILADRDARTGHLTDDTRAALANMWALQMRTGDNAGAWTWLNFHYEPWESPNSPYLGASLAALAIGSAPDGYAAAAAIQEQLTLLRDYFQREYDKQPPLNRLMALWASSKVPGLLTPEQQATLIDATLGSQQADGGWSTAALGPYKRVDSTPLETASDGYATGLATLALQAAAGKTGQTDSRLARGLDWLRKNQDPSTGQWSAASLNKRRDPASDAAKFMNDAATAYAVLSLTQAR